MAKKPKATEEQPTETLVRVEVGTDKAFINGHCLPEGAIVEMTQENIDNHREHGVALIDVAEDDKREVTHDVTQQFVSPDTADEQDE